VYMTGYGRFIATFQPAPTKNVLLRVNQYRLFAVGVLVIVAVSVDQWIRSVKA